MSKFAAAITMPVTDANVQENSTRSITSLVICTLPDCAARAVAVEMLGEPHPIVAREQLFELAFALFERCRPQVLAVQLRAQILTLCALCQT